MSEVPECLCSKEDLVACDWTVDIKMTVRRAQEGDAGYSSTTTHTQEELNILQASAMAARVVDGVNEAMLDELGAELTACFGEDSDMAASLSAMRK